MVLMFSVLLQGVYNACNPDHNSAASFVRGSRHRGGCTDLQLVHTPAHGSCPALQNVQTQQGCVFDRRLMRDDSQPNYAHTCLMYIGKLRMVSIPYISSVQYCVMVTIGCIRSHVHLACRMRLYLDRRLSHYISGHSCTMPTRRRMAAITPSTHNRAGVQLCQGTYYRAVPACSQFPFALAHLFALISIGLYSHRHCFLKLGGDGEVV